MKRFTETEKWRDPWFQKLDPQIRTLWLWVCDRVDNAGVIDICWPICNAETTGSFNEDSMLNFGDRVERLPNGKWFLPKFTEFQFGKLSDDPNHKVHKSILSLLNKHSLCNRVAHRVYHTPKEKEKDKEKEQDKDKENKEHILALEVLAYLNTKVGTHFTAVNGSLKNINARLKEGVSVKEMKDVIDSKTSEWLNNPKMKGYLRPQTLFNGEKFAAYSGALNAQTPIQKPSYSFDFLDKNKTTT